METPVTWRPFEGNFHINYFSRSCPVDSPRYKAHTPCVNYYFPEKTERLKLWLCTLSFPLSAPSSFRWLFFSSRLIQPNSISGVFHPEEAASFFPTLYRRVGWMAVNRLLSESDIFDWNFMIYIALRLDRWTCNQGGLEFNSRPCLKLDFVSQYFRLQILARPCKIVGILRLLMCNWMPFNDYWNAP